MQLFTFCLLIINIAWAMALYFLPSHTTIYNYLYNFSYGLNFILAAILCFKYLKAHPLYRSSLIIFGISFTFFSVAQIVWIYYNVIVRTEVPYPGPADLFWLLFYPTMALGFTTLLAKLKATLTFTNYIEIIITSGIIFLLLSSFLSLNETQIGVSLLTQFFNYAYPVLDAILIALGITILRSQAGHIIPQLLYFIFAFVLLAAGDTIFAYQNTLETYWNGNIVDLIYAISGALFLLGIINLPTLFISSKNSSTIKLL